MLKFSIYSLFLIVSCLSFAPSKAVAREGMWPPATLSQQDSLLKKGGLLIPVNKLYNDTANGLNNAVVLFGNGCTASFISGQGLLLTNHHCGYGYAQRLSTESKNLLTDGFWAMNKNKELPCPGLTITITRKMENVTQYILKDIPDTMAEKDRMKLIEGRMEDMSKAYQYLDKVDAKVVPFFGGNQYWVILTETFKDIRLVAFPPNGIGKFGADIDNWMWPRETGDFSMFRVYANNKNEPAAYSPSNVPYQSKTFLQISTAGYQQGSFAMVYGFPYATEEYLTSFELKRVKDILYPIRIRLRGLKLAIWDSAMRADPAIFLKYAAKQSAISNGYKKWQGVLQGLAANDVLGKKVAYEKKFSEMASKDQQDTAVKMLLPRIAAAVNGNKDALYATEFIREAVFGVEIVKQASLLDSLVMLYRRGSDTALQNGMKKIDKQLNEFYKDYEPELDKRIFETLMPIYMQQNPNVVAPGLSEQLMLAGNNYEHWATEITSESLLAQQDQMDQLLGHNNPNDTFLIKKDPLYQLYAAVIRFEKKMVMPEMKSYQLTMAPLQRKFIAKQMQYPYAPHTFYPDANRTLRLSYGLVQPLALENGNLWQTNLSNLISRHDASNPELNVPKKLRDLYLAKDYGKWSDNGMMPVNFLTTCQTTGGNSGSPVLNAKGQLIGLNFDRPWQGTMSDFYYSDKECRNISVDIRYIMFLVEKYGHSGWLLKEMKFAK